MDSWRLKAARALIALIVVLVVLAILPLTPAPAVDIKVLVYETGALIALGLWAFAPREARQAFPRASVLFPLAMAFLCLDLLAALLSPDMGYSIVRGFARFAALFTLAVVAADAFATPRQLWNLIGVVCAAVALASLYGLLQYAGLDPFPWQNTDEMLRTAPSTFGNPNVASHALALATIMAAGLAVLRRRRWALLCLPLFLAHFSLTRTRGSILALAGAAVLVVAVLVMSRKGMRPARAAALTLGAVAVTGLLGAVLILVATRVSTGQVYPYGEGDSMRLRYHSFYGAALMARERPWLGYGPGMYEVYNPEFWTPMQKDRFSTLRRMDDHVHNEPLEFAVEAGLPAALLYVAILLLGLHTNLVAGFSSSDPERRTLGFTLAAAFLAFLIDGLFGFNAHVPVSALLLFLMVGATASLALKDRMGPSDGSRRAGHGSLSWRIAALGGLALATWLGVRDFTALVYHQRGRGAMEYKDYPAAADCFRRAEALAPYDWMHPHFLGLALAEGGSPDGGADAFARTLDLNPTFLIARFRLAEALFNEATAHPGAGDSATLEQAVGNAEQAAAIGPAFPEVQDLFGRVAMFRAEQAGAAGAADRWREAGERFERAIACGSTQAADLYRLIAFARLNTGDVAGAQRAVVRALDRNPGSLEAWQLYARTCQDSGNYGALLDNLDRRISAMRAARPVPEDTVVSLQLLRADVCHAAIGDDAVAGQAYADLVKTFPARLDAWNAFHAFAEASGRQEAFDACVSRVAADEERAGRPVPPQVRALGRGIATGPGGIAEAASALLGALEHEQTSPTGAGAVPAYLWAAGRLAARAGQMSLPPDTAGDVYYTLGLVCGACGDFHAAARLLGQSLPGLSGGKRLQGLLRLGAALAESGDNAGALKAYDEAASAAPSSLEARHGLATALARNGLWARAQLEYQAILDSFQMDATGRQRIVQELEDARRHHHG